MEIPIINDLAKGLLLDRIRRWFGQRDQRRALMDELAVELLEYRGKLAAGRLVLQSGFPDALRALGGSDYTQQLRPPPRLLKLISPKYMAHEIPLAEALNAILGLVNTTVDAMVLGRQVGGEDPVDDQVIARLLELSDECDQTISVALEELRAHVSAPIKRRLDPEVLARSRQAEHVILEASDPNRRGR